MGFFRFLSNKKKDTNDHLDIPPVPPPGIAKQPVTPANFPPPPAAQSFPHDAGIPPISMNEKDLNNLQQNLHNDLEKISHEEDMNKIPQMGKQDFPSSGQDFSLSGQDFPLPNRPKMPSVNGQQDEMEGFKSILPKPTQGENVGTVMPQEKYRPPEDVGLKEYIQLPKESLADDESPETKAETPQKVPLFGAKEETNDFRVCHFSGAEYMTLELYQFVVSEIKQLHKNIENLHSVLSEVNHTMPEKMKFLNQWKKSLMDFQKKLVFMDKMLFKGEEQ